jgi:hypothetical protein
LRRNFFAAGAARHRFANDPAHSPRTLIVAVQDMSAPLLHIFGAAGHHDVTSTGDTKVGSGSVNKQGVAVMEPRSRNVRPFHQSRPIVPCAQCGDVLFAPEWSEYLDERRIRHLWSCDACDYGFETLVRYPAPQSEAA